MVTIFRSAGLRFVIYVADHEPAHVHVFGDGEAKIDISTVEALTNRGLTSRDLARAIRIVRENRAMFLEKWAAHHG